MAEINPDLYSQIVKHHLATRPLAVQHEPTQDALLPEAIGDKGETDYMNAPASDRGTGDGSIKEPKNPES